MPFGCRPGNVSKVTRAGDVCVCVLCVFAVFALFTVGDVGSVGVAGNENALGGCSDLIH